MTFFRVMFRFLSHYLFCIYAEFLLCDYHEVHQYNILWMEQSALSWQQLISTHFKTLHFYSLPPCFMFFDVTFTSFYFLYHLTSYCSFSYYCF